MLRIANSGQLDAAVVTLEAYAERAGAALACAYSSSAEYDAALIPERRAAGPTGPSGTAIRSSRSPPASPRASRSLFS
jgi:hypothetical protein